MKLPVGGKSGLVSLLIVVPNEILCKSHLTGFNLEYAFRGWQRGRINDRERLRQQPDFAAACNRAKVCLFSFMIL